MAEQSVDANFNQEQLVIRTIQKMSDAAAKNEIEEYFSYFFDAYQLTMNYHDTDARLKLENDVHLYISSVETAKTTFKNEGERDKYVRAVKKDFADTHKYFIMAALANMGIQKIEKEGEIDFAELSFEDLSKVVRNNSGLEGSIKA